MPVRNTDWHFLSLLTSSPKPCGSIWFLRSDVHCDAAIYFLDNSWTTNNTGHTYKGMTRLVEQIDKMRHWPVG
jgi:hypothetical protein